MSFLSKIIYSVHATYLALHVAYESSLSSSLACNDPLSWAGSFAASTGLLPRSSLSDDAPVSTCGFVSASTLSVRLPPALPLRFPSSRFVGNIPVFKRQSKSTIFISE
ncbi:hypothetical protein T10_947 [Trichinella papuae]|uniref:Uncharacterized protein n=1 Tax=Trichinella papuae TaxID=268474 RepID=A0A0V1MGF5_9BILA|nr:hypothetical protein T10_947 [Trichinella papuae]